MPTSTGDRRSSRGVGHRVRPGVHVGVRPDQLDLRFATFFVTLHLLHASHSEFRSGWFVESLATRLAHMLGFAAVTRSTWPAIILRTPKGCTGPKVVDGVQIEGTVRAQQVPLANVRDNPQHLALLESRLGSYHPEELFHSDGRLVPALRALAPTGDKRLGSSPHANGGRILTPLCVPALETYALTVTAPGAQHFETTRPLGELLRDVYRDTTETNNFRLFCPDETNSNRFGAVLRATDRCLVTGACSGDEQISADGRVMEVPSEHLCQGWLEGYLLTGGHGMFATYEAFAMVSASMTIQHAKWLQHARDLAWPEPVASLNILLTSTCRRNDHNGFSHQGPG